MLDKISERVYADTSGQNGGNFGCVVLDDQVVFVDAGMVHTHTARVCDWVRKEFDLPITKLIYTHSHSDHVYGAQGLGILSIIASEQMLSMCEENLKSRWKREAIIESMESRKEERPALWESVQTLEIKLPDIIFSEKISIGSKRDLEVVLRGGHTMGSATVSVEPEHVLFIGDLIFNGVIPYAGDPTCNPDRWIEGLEDIISSDYTTIIPGHGKICDNSELQRHVSFLSELRDRVLNALADGLTQEEFIEKGLFPDYHLETFEYRGPMAIAQFYNHYGAKQQ